jgi:DNA (cytosine-5)-methyltransferase 1
VKPRLLDLFCGAGGAAMGYARAGFDVVGVDIAPQPRYPFEFVQADAREVLARMARAVSLRDPSYLTFDAIHASPPCQAHTAMNVMWNAREHPDLVGSTRDLLEAAGLPYVIENVPGAPLREPVTICGSSLGLATASHELRRHRLFETNWSLMVPPCAHGQRPATIGVYGDHARDRRRVQGAHHDRGRQFPATVALVMAREAMGMPWANWRELAQAIPPAYTELIGHQLMAHVRARVAA